MPTFDGSPYRPGASGDLIDRVVQLRRMIGGLHTDNAWLRRELMRAKQTNRALERELRQAPSRPR